MLDIIPPSSPSDPPTARMAADSDEARINVNQGVARCLMTLFWARRTGLTDLEIIQRYRDNYPYAEMTKGKDVFVRDVMRHWALCKPNDHPQNHLKRNLNLIHQTSATRINPKSGKPMVVFNFIQPPTYRQLEEWKWGTRSPRSVKIKPPGTVTRATENDRDKIKIILTLPSHGSGQLITPFEQDFLNKMLTQSTYTSKQWAKLHEIYLRIL